MRLFYLSAFAEFVITILQDHTIFALKNINVLYTLQYVINSKKLETLLHKSLPLFNALGDPVRQRLLLLLCKGERLSVNELTAGSNLSRPTISHHLKVLKNAQLIVEHKVGREVYYHPQPGEYYASVKELMDMIDDTIKRNEKENQQ